MSRALVSPCGVFMRRENSEEGRGTWLPLLVINLMTSRSHCTVRKRKGEFSEHKTTQEMLAKAQTSKRDTDKSL